MSDLFERLSPTSSQTTDVEMDANDLVATARLQLYVDDGTTIQHIVIGSGPLTRQTADWETVQRPGDTYGSLFAITDYQLLVVAGGCQDPDIEEDYVNTIRLWNVDAVEYDRSFMSSKLTVIDSERVSFSLTPVDDDGLQPALEFLRKASSR